MRHVTPQADLTPLDQRLYDNLRHIPTRVLFKNHCFIKRANADECVIGCESESLTNELKKEPKLKALADAARQTFHSDCRITLVVEKRASN